MDVFNFCWILNESKKSGVFFDKNTCNVRSDIDENFNKPLNRIAYLYKFGSYNIYFFQKCFQEFCTKVPNSSKIIDNFRSLKNLTICSMSAGPGTDIIGFLYSLHLINKPLLNPPTFKVISRFGSWRNLVTEMINSSIINVPDASTCKLIECDFLKDLSKKAQGYFKVADILIMCNYFSSSVTSEKVIYNRLKSVIQLLKPGALVFFIFSKEKSTCVGELFSFGSFLYGPVEVTLENMPYNEKIVELVGVKPLCSGTSLFAVWQKSINNVSDIKAIHLERMSTTNSNREFSSDTNISSNDSLGISSQYSVVSGNSVNTIKPNIASFDRNFNAVKNTSSAPLDISDSSIKKKYELPCGTVQNKTNNMKDINSLLKNFENLITKLEGLINSENSLKHSQVKEERPSNDLNCHQSMYQGHCKCSVKSDQIYEKALKCCCHSKVCCNISIGNHNCSTCIAQNLCKTQEGPCIIIPLQNLSNESVAHILSIVSQNTSVN